MPRPSSASAETVSRRTPAACEDPAPYAASADKPSALFDTRVIYCNYSLEQLARVLKHIDSLYHHCDWHAFQVKVMLY